MNKVTICGGGNGAQTLLPVAARNLGCPVDLFAPLGDEAERLRGRIELTGVLQLAAQPRCASADPVEVIPGSELVMLVLPAFAHESILHQVVPYLEPNAWLGAMPARGGLGYCAAQVLGEHGREDVTVFGLQTLPWACRIVEYGRRVHVLGVKKAVDAACQPASGISEIIPVLEEMLGLPVGSAGTMLALTLANTGQLIHPGIMYGLFGDWDGTPFSAPPPFYHGLDERGVAVLTRLSDEVQAIRRRLEAWTDLSAVRPLKAWLLHAYGDAIVDPTTLGSAFRTNSAYAGLTAPMRPAAQGGFVPDMQARYLAEDVPYGLTVSRAIAQLAGVETPMMDEVVAWAMGQLGREDVGRVPQAYGIVRVEELVGQA